MSSLLVVDAPRSIALPIVACLSGQRKKCGYALPVRVWEKDFDCSKVLISEEEGAKQAAAIFRLWIQEEKYMRLIDDWHLASFD